MNTKKLLKIIAIAIGVLVMAFVVLGIYVRIKLERGDLVRFQGEIYTREQWVRLFDPDSIDVPAKNTPEQVYTAFRQALLNDDIEGALGFIVEGKRGKYKEIFNDENKLSKYKILPNVEDIRKDELNSYDRISSYYYSESEKIYSIEFIKNSEGYWEIESI